MEAHATALSATHLLHLEKVGKKKALKNSVLEGLGGKR
jgi:hypothetical protein